jgi:hypothetical protein
MEYAQKIIPPDLFDHYTATKLLIKSKLQKRKVYFLVLGPCKIYIKLSPALLQDQILSKPPANDQKYPTGFPQNVSIRYHW